jgi:tRNA(fMet)-specific endonuclease VapC
VNYLLDTNACIALINGTPLPVRSRFQKAVDAEDVVFVSSVVTFELWYGVSKSTRPAWNAQRLESFLSGPVRELPFGTDESQVAGRLRATLEIAGRPIGTYDLLVAGQAVHNNLTLVTANIREFSRVKGLLWEDWAKP